MEESLISSKSPVKSQICFANYSLHKDPSKSVLDVGVDNALMFSGFDEKMFFKCGGKYAWSKAISVRRINYSYIRT
jgi:hypothetical protein